MYLIILNGANSTTKGPWQSADVVLDQMVSSLRSVMRFEVISAWGGTIGKLEELLEEASVAVGWLG